MPRFALTFDYPGTCGETVIGKHTLTRETLEKAVEHAANVRGVASIHVRTINGEAVDRLFTFGTSERVA